MPPDKLLPDRQPAYVASWVYVFGVATLAALGVVIVTGGLDPPEEAPPGGTSPGGHFVNSLHLWTVELFIFVLVLHLWAKFFMAAWRGRRALTWITGALAFLPPSSAAFSGYPIAAELRLAVDHRQGKDGLNRSGSAPG